MEELNFSSGMTKFDKVAKFEDTILNFYLSTAPIGNHHFYIRCDQKWSKL